MDDRGGGTELRSALQEATRDVEVPAGLVRGAVHRGRGRLRRRRSLGAGAAVLALVAGGVVTVRVDDAGAPEAASAESPGGGAAAGSAPTAASESAPLADAESGSAADGSAAGALPCPPGGWTASMPPDFEGEPDPRAALGAWLDGDPSMPAPHAEPPRDGWSEEPSGRPDVVVLTNGDWEVTTTRSTRGEWLVTSAGCW